MKRCVLEEQCSVFDGLNAKLIEIIAEKFEQGVGEGNFEEPKLDEKLLVSEKIEIFGDGFFILLDDGVHLLVLEFYERDPELFDESSQTI